YRDDAKDSGVAAQIRKQDEDMKRFTQQPFVPDLAASSATVPMISADPEVAKGLAIFQVQSCNSCHGDGGVGTAAAGPLIGIGQKYTTDQIIALIRSPNAAMTNGGMPALDPKKEDIP